METRKAEGFLEKLFNTESAGENLAVETARKLVKEAGCFDIRDTDAYRAFAALYETDLEDIVLAADFVASCATDNASASVCLGNYVYTVERRKAASPHPTQ